MTVGGSFALRLQLLPSARDKVLALASLIAARNGDGSFSAAEIGTSFREMAIPAPANVSAALTRLKDADLAVTTDVRGRWKLTPVGRATVADVLTGLDPAALSHELADFKGAEFAHVSQTVIPPWAAPPKWQVGINRLLERFPFESNVFCMTRFPSEGGESDPVKNAIVTIKTVLSDFGLTTHLASDRLIEDDLLGNVGAYMWACHYGIGIIEDRVGRGLNYNAVIELGGMIITGRRCALLKDAGTPPLPTDLSGQVYKGVDLDDEESVATEVARWAREDLGLTGSRSP